MSNEAFREFLKRDRLRRKLPHPSISALKVESGAGSAQSSTPKLNSKELSGTITDRSACIIEIRNRFPAKLTQPKFYCCYGTCFSPPGDIEMGSSETFAFTHSSPLVSGMFSYQIREKFLWVLYSAYEDRNFFSMAITPGDFTMGVELFVTMANNSRERKQRPEMQFGWAKDGGVTVQSGNLVAVGRMTPDVKSILEIEMSSSSYDPK